MLYVRHSGDLEGNSDCQTEYRKIMQKTIGWPRCARNLTCKAEKKEYDLEAVSDQAKKLHAAVSATRQPVVR